MLLKCQCCGYEQEFKDGEEAFQAGWDAPPHFTGFICCHLCPAVCVVMNKGHTMAHALWEREGRPKQWTFAKCCTDDNFGDKAEEAAFTKSFEEFLEGNKREEGV